MTSTVVPPRHTVPRQSPRSGGRHSSSSCFAVAAPSTKREESLLYDAISTRDDEEPISTSLKTLSEVLHKPYVDSPPSPPSPKPWIRPPNTSSARFEVDRSLRPAIENDSDEEEVEDPDAQVPQELQWEFAYMPSEKWAWTANQPLSRWTLLRNIRAADNCKVNLMRGLLGRRPVMFICKSWSRARDAMHTGLYKEIKLFSSDSYMRSLQGDVVPNLINIYDDIHQVHLVMEPPHHSFWIEASPRMSNALKKRVVEAYLKLHRCGVVHGAAETRNMLIGGDGRVMLVNFADARSSRPIPGIGLEAANNHDMELELRKVMFLLNYAGAWKLEENKMRRVSEQVMRNYDRAKLRDLKRLGIYDGPVEAEEWPMIEDNEHPPPRPSEWNKWCESLRSSPSRFVVPGQTTEQFANAVAEYHSCVRRLETHYARQATSPILIVEPEYIFPSRNIQPFDATSAEDDRKRKAAELDVHDIQPATKRPRRDDNPHPTVRAQGSVWAYSSKTYSTGTSEHLLPAATTSSVDPLPVKTRDFATEPHEGSRGYYVPYPPNEHLMASYRIAHIRNATAIECGLLGLPYWRGDEEDHCLTIPSYRHRPPRGLHVAFGFLKRQRDELEGNTPVTIEEQRAAKKKRFEEDRDAARAEKRPIRFDDHLSYCDAFAYNKYTRLSGPVSYPRHRRTPAKPLRSILKQTAPRRTVSWDLGKWLSHTADEERFPMPLRKQRGSVVHSASSPEIGLESRRGPGNPSDRCGTNAPELGQSPTPQPPCTAPADATVNVQGAHAALPACVSSYGKVDRLRELGESRTHRRSTSRKLSPEELEQLEVEIILSAPDEALPGGGDVEYERMMNVREWLELGGGQWE